MISSDSNRYRTVKRGASQRTFVPDGEADSPELVFEDEYCFFKLFCGDVSDLPIGGSIQIYSNGQPCYSHNGMPISLDIPTEGFFWEIAFLVGMSKLSIHVSDDCTDDVEFSLTGYERVER